MQIRSGSTYERGGRRFANWARGYFWNDVSAWRPDRFDALPKNPLCDWPREYATKGLGQANQWGDGPWAYWLYEPRCLTAAEDYDKAAITIPKAGTNVAAMEEEFVRTLKNPAVYQSTTARPVSPLGHAKSGPP